MGLAQAMKPIGSCSSRVHEIIDAMDGDVDLIAIEEDKPSSSDNAIADLDDDDDDAGTFSIVNGYSIEEEDTLADIEHELLAVPYRALLKRITSQ